MTDATNAELERLLGPREREVGCERVLRPPRPLRGTGARRARTPTLGSPGWPRTCEGCPACREEHESLRALLADDARGPG